MNRNNITTQYNDLNKTNSKSKFNN